MISSHLLISNEQQNSMIIAAWSKSDNFISKLSLDRAGLETSLVPAFPGLICTKIPLLHNWMVQSTYVSEHFYYQGHL